MFERFSAGARAVVVDAQDSARALGHRYIGTEHLLLGLLKGGDEEVSAKVLAALGITRERVIADIERLIAQGRDDAAPQRDIAAADKAALATIGIDLDAVQAAIEKTFGPGALEEPGRHSTTRSPWWRRRQSPNAGGAPRGHIPFTPRAKKVLELSLREALALKHDYIGTEHLLLGLVREARGLAAQILVAEGARLEVVREEVLAQLERAG